MEQRLIPEIEEKSYGTLSQWSDDMDRETIYTYIYIYVYIIYI